MESINENAIIPPLTPTATTITGQPIVKRKSPTKDTIIFSLIFIVILLWSYTLYLWMICCFNWSASIYKQALASIVTSSILTIVAIVVVIVLSRLKR